MGHSQGLLVSSPSLGLRPELPCSMTWCDSRMHEREEGARSRTEEFGSLSSTFQSACGFRTVRLHETSPYSKPHLGSGLVDQVSRHLTKEWWNLSLVVTVLTTSPSRPPTISGRHTSLASPDPFSPQASHLEVEFIDFDPQNYQ